MTEEDRNNAEVVRGLMNGIIQLRRHGVKFLSTFPGEDQTVVRLLDQLDKLEKAKAWFELKVLEI